MNTRLAARRRRTSDSRVFIPVSVAGVNTGVARTLDAFEHHRTLGVWDFSVVKTVTPGGVVAYLDIAERSSSASSIALGWLELIQWCLAALCDWRIA